jgi:hypothetical protein
MILKNYSIKKIPEATPVPLSHINMKLWEQWRTDQSKHLSGFSNNSQHETNVMFL